MLRFADPHFLLLLVAVPLMGWWYWRRQRRGASLRYSNLGLVKDLAPTPSSRWRHGLTLLRLFAIGLLVIAAARPQSGTTSEEVTTEGIDIVLAIDVSSSMLAEDFKPKNRIEAAKIVAANFVEGRRNDRIGMVVFAAMSFTQCPLTLDYGVLLNLLKEVKVGIIDDGTAIGLGVANAVSRLKDSKAKSKVIILLTDGRNNRGEIDPLTAARIAQAFKVRLYAVGVGSRGEALYPVDDPFFGKRYVRMPVDIDEDMLRGMARITDGKYFRATDRESLQMIFAEIDKLAKTKIEVKQFTRYKELFMTWLALALGIVVLEIVLSNTRFRKIP